MKLQFKFYAITQLSKPLKPHNLSNQVKIFSSFVCIKCKNLFSFIVWRILNNFTHYPIMFELFLVLRKCNTCFSYWILECEAKQGTGGSEILLRLHLQIPGLFFSFLYKPLYLRGSGPDRPLGLGGGHLLLQPLEVLGLLRLLRLLLLVHLHAAELRPAHRALADYLQSRQQLERCCSHTSQNFDLSTVQKLFS